MLLHHDSRQRSENDSGEPIYKKSGVEQCVLQTLRLLVISLESVYRVANRPEKRVHDH